MRERGSGSIFRKPNTKNWWIAYSFRGHPYQESSGSTDRKVALKLLQDRLRKVNKPHFADPAKERRYTLDDMLEQLKLSYESKQNNSFHTVTSVFKHVQKEFEFHRVVDITGEEIAAYASRRSKPVSEGGEGAARGSVNLELACLRHGFKLMFEKKMISEVPVIKLFELHNARRGFLDIGEFAALLESIRSPDVRDIVEFLYNSGWRSNEARELRWAWIDLSTNMIRLPGEFSKSKEPRMLPLTGALADVIERRLRLRRLDCEFVFHRKGKPIRQFYKAFKAAAREIGMPGLLPHDMRRSAVRNFRRAGLSEHEGMALSGHKTNDVYERYNIISESDLTESMAKVQSHLKKEAENRKVVPLNKKQV
jgi:site-specific recombinase XerC